MKKKIWDTLFGVVGVYGLIQLIVWVCDEEITEKEKRKLLKIYDPKEDIWEFIQLIKNSKKEGM
mgnify:CR=1 FL=1